MGREMILFVGIQASGKTSFYKQNFASEYVHVSLDILHTRNKERLAMEQCVSMGQSFVVDNTNATRKDRERYITFAKKYKYQVIGYYFRSGVKECMERNEHRIGKTKVPRCAIAATSNKLELPDYVEGFDKLYYVYIDEGLKVEDWRSEDEV